MGQIRTLPISDHCRVLFPAVNQEYGFVESQPCANAGLANTQGADASPLADVRRICIRTESMLRAGKFETLTPSPCPLPRSGGEGKTGLLLPSPPLRGRGQGEG